MNVISYFNLIAGSKFSAESQELINIWKKIMAKNMAGILFYWTNPMPRIIRYLTN